MKRIRKNEMSNIFEKRIPLGMFYREGKSNKTGHRLFIGVDNRTSEAWTEEFKTVEELKGWFEKKSPVIICKNCKKNMCETGIAERVNRQEWDNYMWDGKNMIIGDTASGDSEIMAIECKQCGYILTKAQVEKFSELY